MNSLSTEFVSGKLLPDKPWVDLVIEPNGTKYSESNLEN